MESIEKLSLQEKEQSTTDGEGAEDGELHDSGDEDAQEKPEAPLNQLDGNVKDAAPIRTDFDESRPEDEQLDYGEDELEKIQAVAPAQKASDTAEKSDGEADSDSEGEIKSDVGDDFEEGETRDHPLDVPPEKKKVCRFYEMGNCTWGDRCRYLHPGVNDKGNYDMFREELPKRPAPPRREQFMPPPHHPDPFWEEPSFIPPPVAETAWEKGLRHAKEMKKRAMQRKVHEPDFLQKREVISTIGALNEDRDMEFVNIAPLANKGYDPFKEEEGGEYATPTAEEVRRHLMRDRRPPPHRQIIGKDHRLPPPAHIVHPDSHRERRPPSPRHDRFPPNGPPRLDIDREPRGNFPPTDHGFGPHRRDRPDFPDTNQRMHNSNRFRREATAERDDKSVSDVSKGAQNGGPPSGPGQSWNDPWARGRLQAKGRNKAKSVSSSSSGSSSGSSSRSSSSGSSRSSYSGSSKSSSGSDSSSSSDRDSSRSPSPNKVAKKKVLTTAKQRNAKSAKTTLPPPKIPVAANHMVPTKTDDTALAVNKVTPVVPVKKPPLVPNQTAAVPVPPKKAIQKKKVKKASSSSSEFSHSSDSSPSPSRKKDKSDSDSDSGSSSGSSSSSASSSSSSSSSDSEGDKPANRRKKKPINPASQATQPAQRRPVQPPPQPTINKGKVTVPSKPGRKDVKMTIIDKPGVPKKRTAAEMTSHGKKPSSRRTELLEQLKAVEDAIARKRAKMT